MKLHEIAELQAKQDERIIFSGSKAHPDCRLLFSEVTGCIIYAKSGDEYIIDIYDLLRSDWVIVRVENEEKLNGEC